MADLTPTLTIHAAEKSGAPTAAIRTIKQWAESNLVPGSTGYGASIAKVKLHGVAFAQGVRASGEGAVFGAILGGVHGALPQGLDIPIPGTKSHMPADGLGALLGIVAGTFAAAEPYGIGQTLSNGGASCATVFSFRKMNDLMVNLKARKAAGFRPGEVSVGVAPGTISKATFTGESEGTGRRAVGTFAKGSEDPVVAAARGV